MLLHKYRDISKCICTTKYPGRLTDKRWIILHGRRCRTSCTRDIVWIPSYFLSFLLIYISLRNLFRRRNFSRIAEVHCEKISVRFRWIEATNERVSSIRLVRLPRLSIHTVVILHKQLLFISLCTLVVIIVSTLHAESVFIGFVSNKISKRKCNLFRSI